MGWLGGSAKAAVIVNAIAAGGVLTIAASGTLNIDGLTNGGVDTSTTGGGFYVTDDHRFQRLVVGGDGVSDSGALMYYLGTTPNKQLIGPGNGKLNPPDDVTGRYFSFYSDINGNAYVDFASNYVSGTPFTSTDIFLQDASFSPNPNNTYQALGLMPGRYRYDLYQQITNKYVDTVTINVGVMPVPLPASAPLFGAALLGLAGLGCAIKRRKAV